MPQNMVQCCSHDKLLNKRTDSNFSQQIVPHQYFLRGANKEEKGRSWYFLRGEEELFSLKTAGKEWNTRGQEWNSWGQEWNTKGEEWMSRGEEWKSWGQEYKFLSCSL